MYGINLSGVFWLLGVSHFLHLSVFKPHPPKKLILGIHSTTLIQLFIFVEWCVVSRSVWSTVH